MDRTRSEHAACHGAKVCESFPVGCCRLDATGTIIEINAAAASLLGEEEPRLFGTKLSRYLAPRQLVAFRAHLARACLAVLFVDLGGFKLINDAHGHHVGDAVLKKAASRASRVLRESDTVARIGGDELVLLIAPLDAPEIALSIAQRLLEALKRPYRSGRVAVSASASIGMSLYPDDGVSAEELIGRADAAMYRAKEAGRGRYHYFGREATRPDCEPVAAQEVPRRTVASGPRLARSSPRPTPRWDNVGP